ncbi:MAG: acyltransferase [Pseudobutyrivibrio sp.]|nr:acyltransferase [Pseudobutyrivibrio sp.]
MKLLKQFLKKIRYVDRYIRFYHKFNSFGKHSVIKKPFRLINMHNVDVGDYCLFMPGLRLETIEHTNWNNQKFTPHITFGDHVEVQQGVHIVATHNIKIGNNVGIGPYSMINDTRHVYTDPDTPIMYQPLDGGNIEIGDGSMLGMGACVLPGVKIGKNCFIGANCVVAKDVPDNTIVSPAKNRKATIPVD